MIMEQSRESNVYFYESETTLRDIIERQVADSTEREDIDDAFYVADLGKVISQYRRWEECLPRVQPFYAMKSNPDPMLLRVLHELGAGFDCASKHEVAAALECGVLHRNLIYAHPCKQESHVKFAKRNAVSLMVFDNEDELVKIKKIYPEARLVLRIATEDSCATVRLSHKFGCMIDEVQTLLISAKQMELNVVGICFHVGSLCQDPEGFSQPIRDARRVFDAAHQLGFKMEILDVGGGFPGDFRDKPGHFEKMAEVINRELEHCFPASSHPNLRIIGEPGRYFAGHVFTLVVNVVGRRRLYDGKSEDPNHNHVEEIVNKGNKTGLLNGTFKPVYRYYLNDGFYGTLFHPILRHLELVPSCLKERNCDDLKYSCSLWGQTCSGLDFITKHCVMPKLEVGEWLFFENVGAYTLACASTFNGFNIPVCQYVAPKHHMSILNKCFAHIDTTADGDG